MALSTYSGTSAVTACPSAQAVQGTRPVMCNADKINFLLNVFHPWLLGFVDVDPGDTEGTWSQPLLWAGSFSLSPIEGLPGNAFQVFPSGEQYCRTSRACFSPQQLPPF